MMEDYIPLVFMLIFGFAVAVIFLYLSEWLGARRPTEGKRSIYESGMPPRGTARERFSVKFYMVAVSFIVFDVEIVFMYPWAVTFTSLPLSALIGMLAFIAILFAGYFYELKKGGFEWD